MLRLDPTIRRGRVLYASGMSWKQIVPAALRYGVTTELAGPLARTPRVMVLIPSSHHQIESDNTSYVSSLVQIECSSWYRGTRVEERIKQMTPDHTEGVDLQQALVCWLCCNIDMVVRQEQPNHSGGLATAHAESKRWWRENTPHSIWQGMSYIRDENALPTVRFHAPTPQERADPIRGAEYNFLNGFFGDA